MQGNFSRRRCVNIGGMKWTGRLRQRGGVSVLIVLSLVVSACVSSNSRSGEITGIAPPCSVEVAPGHTGAIQVRIVLLRQSHIAATQVAPVLGRYHFTVLAGRYVVTDRAADGLPDVVPVKVNLRAGEVVHVDLVSLCQ